MEISAENGGRRGRKTKQDPVDAKGHDTADKHGDSGGNAYGTDVFDAKNIFLRMEEAKSQFQNYAEQETVVFRIGCMTEVELNKLEPVLKQMKERYPYLRPKVVVRDFFELKNLYENQQMDIVVSVEGLSGQGNFKKMVTYESYAVMSEDHPLAAETELSLEQIANETLITLPPRCIPFQKGNQFQEYLTLHAQDHVHLVSDSEAESILLAKCGYGIALLPGFFIEKAPVAIKDKGTVQNGY